MPDNMSKPSMLPAPNHFPYAPSFIGMYQHLFICHLLCPTDFQHPLPRPHFKRFQQLTTCFSQHPGLCCIQCYIPNCAVCNSLYICHIYHLTTSNGWCIMGHRNKRHMTVTLTVDWEGLTLSARVPELNTFKCNRLMPLHFEVLRAYRVHHWYSTSSGFRRSWNKYAAPLLALIRALKVAELTL